MGWEFHCQTCGNVWTGEKSGWIECKCGIYCKAKNGQEEKPAKLSADDPVTQHFSPSFAISSLKKSKLGAPKLFGKSNHVKISRFSANTLFSSAGSGNDSSNYDNNSISSVQAHQPSFKLQRPQPLLPKFPLELENHYQTMQITESKPLDDQGSNNTAYPPPEQPQHLRIMSPLSNFSKFLPELKNSLQNSTSNTTLPDQTSNDNHNHANPDYNTSSNTSSIQYQPSTVLERRQVVQMPLARDNTRFIPKSRSVSHTPHSLSPDTDELARQNKFLPSGENNRSPSSFKKKPPAVPRRHSSSMPISQPPLPPRPSTSSVLFHSSPINTEIATREDLDQQLAIALSLGNPAMYNDIEQAVAFCERNSERQRRVIVYDLGESFSEEDLVAMCRPFGNIIFSMIQRDASGKSEGFGLVTFSNQYEAEDAVRKLNYPKSKGSAILEKEEQYICIDTQQDKQANTDTDGSLCCICIDNPIASVCFVPCGHQKYCEDCANKVAQGQKICPICRAKIQSVLKIYK